MAGLTDPASGGMPSLQEFMAQQRRQQRSENIQRLGLAMAASGARGGSWMGGLTAGLSQVRPMSGGGMDQWLAYKRLQDEEDERAKALELETAQKSLAAESFGGEYEPESGIMWHGPRQEPGAPPQASLAGGAQGRGLTARGLPTDRRSLALMAQTDPGGLVKSMGKPPEPPDERVYEKGGFKIREEWDPTQAKFVETDRWSAAKPKDYEQFERIEDPEAYGLDVGTVAQRSKRTGRISILHTPKPAPDPDIIKDAEGYQRYATGSKAGERVFPGVQKTMTSENMTALQKDVPYIAEKMGVSERKAMEMKMMSAGKTRDAFEKDAALRFISGQYMQPDEAAKSAKELADIIYGTERAKPKALTEKKKGVFNTVLDAMGFGGDEAEAAPEPTASPFLDKIPAMDQNEVSILVKERGNELSEAERQAIMNRLDELGLD